MTAWLGTRVCFIDLTWSKRPGRRPLRFSKPGTIIRQLIFQIMLRAPGDRKQPCALSNVISVVGFPQTGCSGIGPKDGSAKLIFAKPRRACLIVWRYVPDEGSAGEWLLPEF